MIRSCPIILLIILAFGMSGAEAKDALESTVILEFDLNESVNLSACRDVGEWTIKKINKIHEPNDSLSNDIEELSANSGLNQCFFSDAQCKARSWTYSNSSRQVAEGVEYENFNIWYVKPYPTVYSTNKDGERSINKHSILGGLSANQLEFVPISDSIDSLSKIISIENSFVQSTVNGEFQFFDIKASYEGEGYRADERSLLQPNIKEAYEITEGKALCRVSKRRWGVALPDRCVVTRFKNDKGHYVLGLLKSWQPYIVACPASATFETLQLLSFGGVSTDGFKDHLLISLTEGDLNMDSDRIDVDGDTVSGMTVFASAGPRLSSIDTRIREQIDITLRFKPSQDNYLSTKVYLAAWVSRQNTDPAGSWRMPEQSYYGELERKLKIAVNNAFDAACKGGNRQPAPENSVFGRIRECH